MRALQVAVVAAFIDDEDCRSAQASCLQICNTCREVVPAPCIRVGPEAPLTLLAMLFPDASAFVAPSTSSPSRVEVHRRVRKVELTFPDNPSPLRTRSGAGEEEETEDGAVEQDSGPPTIVADIMNSVDAICAVQWPSGTTEICLRFFDRSIDGALWPDGLERLSFGRVPTGSPVERRSRPLTPDAEWVGGIFNQPLDGARFPPGLQEMYLGSSFNQPIDSVEWPAALVLLSLSRFNHSIQGVRWPERLKTLEFMPKHEILRRQDENTCLSDMVTEDLGFNQHIGTGLPPSVETLWLSDAFCQPLTNVTWPSGLSTIGVGEGFPMAQCVWPERLRQLHLVYEPLWDNDSVPDGCKLNVVEWEPIDWRQFVSAVEDLDRMPLDMLDVLMR